MSWYKIRFDGYLGDDVFDSYDEAEEAALVMVSNFNQGASDLWNSNPGDYDIEWDGNTGEYEIIEVDQYGNEI